MKKMLCAAMAAAMVMGTCASVFADGIGVSVNDNLIEAQGVIVESRTLVPVRGVFEELGYSVDWDAETKTVIITTDGAEVVEDTTEETTEHTGGLKIGGVQEL